MNITEAYNIFNLKPTQPLDDFKKRHKELVKKYHPDLNKSEDTSKKMSEVNEAFDMIKKHKEGKHFNHYQAPEEITIYKDISFADAVYGCRLNIEYDRQSHCEVCEGSGVKRISDCKTCNGSGIIEKIEKSQFGTTVSRTTCRSCIGKFKEEQCNDCFSLGKKTERVNINVNVPGGVKPHSKLILRNMGNFCLQNTIFGPQLSYLDAYLVVNYEESKEFKIVNKNLEVDLKISFLNSIKGFERELILPDNSKVKISSTNQIQNNHLFTFPNKGVGREGNLNVNVNVENIPEEYLDKIINIIENNV